MKANTVIVVVVLVILVLGGGYFFLSQRDANPVQSVKESVMPTNTDKQTSALNPPKECGEPTPNQTEGPYYKTGSPERTNLREEGIPGEPLTVTGYVMDANCQPIKNAWIDFWQADGNGEYDNEGYKLRGHQYTDSEGKYFLETVIPGLYTGRTPHIHVKVKANEESSVITAQLYFPENSQQNSGDSIYRAETLLDVKGNGEKIGYYNFYLSE